MISLGAKEGTKVGRKQVTFIIERQSPIAETVMRSLVNLASPGCSFLLTRQPLVMTVSWPQQKKLQAYSTTITLRTHLAPGGPQR